MMKQESYSSVKHKFKFLATVVSWTVFVLLLIVAGLLLYYFVAARIYANKGDQYKPAFGLYTIVSPSMEPNLLIYDVIVNVNVKKPQDIKVGDVITFVSTASISKGMTITHRVISISQENGEYMFQTKGDNNLSPDSVPVPFSKVLGKVVMKLPQLGRLQSFLATKGGWLVVVVIPAIIVIVSDLLKILRLQGAQKNIEEVTLQDEARKEEEELSKKEIEDKLAMKLKPKRADDERDPLVSKTVIVKVGEEDKKDLGKEDLPKLKPVNNGRIRTRRKNNKNRKNDN